MKKVLLPALLSLGSLALANTAAAQTMVYAQWPLTTNNMPTLGTGTMAGASVLRRYVLSNNVAPSSTTTAYPAYSADGQAFGIQADGGGWSSNAVPTPGPGSRPKRIYYEQFAVTSTAAGRADSVTFNAIIPYSAAGIVAVTYSLSNYTTDSASVSDGGKGPGGATGTGILPTTANGTFGLNPAGTPPAPSATAYNGATIPQLAMPAPPSTYRFALNGATGVNIPAGRTLTVRLHFGCGSTGVGRYILLKNVTIGRRVLATRSAVNTNLAVSPNPTQNQVVVPHAIIGQDARIAVYNTVGAQVASAVAKAGTSQTTLSLETLAQGLYLVEYANGQERSSARVVKE